MTYEIKQDTQYGLFYIENSDGDVMGIDGKWHSQPGQAEQFTLRKSAEKFAARNAR